MLKYQRNIKITAGSGLNDETRKPESKSARGKYGGSLPRPIVFLGACFDLPLIRQAEYRIVVRPAAEANCAADTGFLKSSRSAGVGIGCWEKRLLPDTLYFWNVILRDPLGEESASDAAAFITESAFMKAPAGIWHPAGPISVF